METILRDYCPSTVPANLLHSEWKLGEAGTYRWLILLPKICTVHTFPLVKRSLTQFLLLYIMRKRFLFWIRSKLISLGICNIIKEFKKWKKTQERFYQNASYSHTFQLKLCNRQQHWFVAASRPVVEFSKKYCAILAWPEVDLRFCPNLPMFRQSSSHFFLIVLLSLGGLKGGATSFSKTLSWREGRQYNLLYPIALSKLGIAVSV